MVITISFLLTIKLAEIYCWNFLFYFRIGLQGTKELPDNKIVKRTLQKGLLLEFQKDPERSLLAVVERPDGKKNWMVTDQVVFERMPIACPVDYPV